MRIEAVVYLENFEQTAENGNNLLKMEKTTASQTHFGFTNIGSDLHGFRIRAI